MHPHERTQCYLCGITLDKSNRTSDHVPPKGLFPRPFVDKPLTVPCCLICNNDKSSEEEFFRLLTTLGIHETPEKIALYEQRVVPNTLGRGRLKHEITEMVGKMRHQWIEVNGVMVLSGLVPLPVPLLKRVAERIARGLVAYFNPKVEVHSLHCDTFIPTRSKLWEVLAFIGEDLQEFHLGGRVFHAYHGTIPDTPSTGLWLMTFHETIAAAVFHFDEDTLRTTNAEQNAPQTP